MNKLYIDTRNNERIIVRLETKSEKFEQVSKASQDKAQAALPLIKNILEEANLKPHEVSEVIVETGTGSFTGLRVGVSIANALSFGLLVKINGKKLSDLATPKY
jgi:tRNA threonylcarbamoyladenosine biosynthesis protein TsaB